MTTIGWYVTVQVVINLLSWAIVSYVWNRQKGWRYKNRIIAAIILAGNVLFVLAWRSGLEYPLDSPMFWIIFVVYSGMCLSAAQLGKVVARRCNRSAGSQVPRAKIC